MKLFSENKDYKLYEGNMLDMLETIEKESIDSIVCDPPYELNFMGKGWDNSGIAFNKDTWKQCYEVLKPGGYLLAFGGSRTYHRIACAIEDAGFEIRDTIMWLYGSGFPKSMNIGLAIDKKNGVESEVIGKAIGNINKMPDGRPSRSQIAWESKPKEYEIKKAQNEWAGWGTALKPSFEPIIVARKPFKGSCVENVLKYGVGGINIDECRVEYENTTNPATNPLYRQQNKDKYKQVVGGELSNGAVSWTSGKNGVNEGGRFPANTILTYDETDFDEVCGGFPNSKGKGAFPKKIKGNTNITFRSDEEREKRIELNDSGSAARYFYCAKASKRDRDEGLDEFIDTTVNDGRETPIDNAFQRGETPRKNTHPTVKPTNLMQYLVRLVTPNGGIVLDPFNGSGSTGKAVMYENKERNKGYKYIGIELTEEYLPIAKARIEYVCNLKDEEIKDMQMSIYDEK